MRIICTLYTVVFYHSYKMSLLILFIITNMRNNGCKWHTYAEFVCHFDIYGLFMVILSIKDNNVDWSLFNDCLENKNSLNRV